MMRLAVCAMALGVLGCATGGGTPEGGSTSLAETQVSGTNREGRDAHSLISNSDLGSQTTVPAPLDTAFSAITTAYKSLGVDIKMSDPSQHRVGNQRIVAMHTWLGSRLSAYFNCGTDAAIGSQRADSYRLTISVVSTLSVKDPQNTRVITLATAQANEIGTSASTVTCSSTGKIERSLLTTAGYEQ